MSQCIFVQGPQRAAAGFCGRWLHRAARADDLWLEVRGKPRYAGQLESLPRDYLPNFGAVALEIVSQLPSNAFTAIVDGDEATRRWFLMMRLLGFFSGGFGTGHEKYEMFVPPRIGLAGVKIAVVAGVRMADPRFWGRAEYSSATVSRDHALAWRELRIREVLQDAQYFPITRMERRLLH